MRSGAPRALISARRDLCPEPGEQPLGWCRSSAVTSRTAHPAATSRFSRRRSPGSARPPRATRRRTRSRAQVRDRRGRRGPRSPQRRRRGTAATASGDRPATIRSRSRVSGGDSANSTASAATRRACALPRPAAGRATASRTSSSRTMPPASRRSSSTTASSSSAPADQLHRRRHPAGAAQRRPAQCTSPAVTSGARAHPRRAAIAARRGR